MSGAILVVDDEEGLRTTLAANLELDGFDVVEAKNGLEALARLRERQFDLVLTDIRMPGMDGVELFREIRKRIPGLPVALMTAFAMETLVRQALREGAVMVVNKPFPVGQLLSTLHRVMAHPVVLVVNDDAGGAGATATALAALGLRTEIALDSQTAMASVRTGRIGVAVVDLMIGAHTGDRLIDEMRASQPDLMVVAIAGELLAETLPLAAVRAHAIMRKPFGAADLVEAIGRARARPDATR